MMLWIAGYAVLMIKVAVILTGVLLVAAYLVLLERKLLGRFQARIGPNRAGIFGLLQPIADGIKLLAKEDVMLDGAERAIFLFAPAIVATTALLSFVAVPFGPDLTIGGQTIPMVVTDMSVGLLFVFSMASLSVYGIALGGWASNSKYSMFGEIRGVAQMISYELALGLSIVPVVMLAGSFSLVDIVNAQAGLPYIVIQPVAFLIFFIASMAESKRIPFDLHEAEAELGAGYHTEYSGMRFGMFFLGEYVQMQVLGALVAIFFLGGWRGPILPPPLWLLVKIILAATVMVWIRATLPRFRYDQLMDLGWKFLIPAALVNIIITGVLVVVF